VGTWNLENLFRPAVDGGPADDAAYEAKLDSLAGAITGLAPDVLAVQEVGQPEALEDLKERLDGRWHTETSAFPDARGIRVGFLSRLALAEVRQARPFPERLDPVQVDDDGPPAHEMGRGALRARVNADGEDLDLVTCHLKSKLLSFPGQRFSARDEGERARFAAYALYRRSAEAVTVRAEADKRLDGHGSERPVIVLGDLTDEPDAGTIQIPPRPRRLGDRHARL
jgi:endonuclease/exonuclease/phosphatase family metal-dependent hydrolase